MQSRGSEGGHKGGSSRQRPKWQGCFFWQFEGNLSRHFGINIEKGIQTLFLTGLLIHLYYPYCNCNVLLLLIFNLTVTINR
jgi:hypothetical protein